MKKTFLPSSITNRYFDRFRCYHLREKPLVLLALLLLTPLLAISQVKLSGKVMDSLYSPLDGVNILLTDLETNSIVDGAITDKQGEFSFSTLKKGTYEIEWNYLGFETHTEKINLLKDTDIGIIRLKEGNNQLGEILISVEEKKPIIEMKIDRTIFNISQSDAVIGGNTIDALRVTPGLKIRDNKIEMAGKGSVKLLINDREVRLQGKNIFEYLKSIPSDQIERIEMITNPPAKYTAEGSFGVINIVLKKGAQDQFFGIVSGKLHQSHDLSNSENISLFYHKNDLQINGGAHYFDERGRITNLEQVDYSSYTMKEDHIADRKIQGFGGFFEIEYALSEQTFIGANLRYSRTPNSQIRRTIHEDYLREAQVDSTLLTKSRDKSIFDTQSYNLYLDRKLDTVGSKFSGEVSFINYKQDKNENSLSQNSTTQEIFDLSSSNTTQIQLLHMALDTELKRGFADYSFGLQASSSQTKNHSNYASPDLAEQNSEFKYDENIFSAYLSAAKTFNDKWSIKLGLRSEYTLSNGNSLTLQEVTKRKELELFPSAYLNYHLNTTNSFTLSYGRRINRPPYNFLDPFRSYLSPYSYSEGNPYLRPAYNNNFELKHLYKSKLATSLYFSYIPNDFDYLEIVSEGSPVFASVFDNYLKVYKFGLTEAFYWKPFKWWESDNEAAIYYSKSKSDNPNTESKIDGLGTYVATGNTLTLNKKKTFRANLNFTYYFPEVNGMDKDKTYYYLDLGVTALFFSKKLTLTLQADDIFRTAIYRSASTINGIPYRFEADYDAQSVSFSASYKFGNSETRKQRKVYDENSERI